MEFTKDQLRIIETALEELRDNTGDDDWYVEISSVLTDVRDELKKETI